MDELISFRCCFVGFNEKTQLIVISPTTKSAISDYGMESSCANSIPKSIHADSKSKNL